MVPTWKLVSPPAFRIVHLTVDGGTGGIGAVAHKDEVFFGSFLALCRGVVAVPQNTCHFLCFFDRVEQGSTNIIDGVEMESLRRDVESALPFFKEIRVGTPLLYSIEDAEKVASILWNRYNAPAQSKKATKEHFVMMSSMRCFSPKRIWSMNIS